MSDINIGAISEALNDKTDRDMRNVDNTAGADAVIEYQVPTAENGYTWYRKYASGWVEQGGYRDGSGVQSVTFPISMANSNYTVVTAIIRPNNSSASAITALVYNQTTTGFVIVKTYGNGGYADEDAMWQVSGMAA